MSSTRRRARPGVYRIASIPPDSSWAPEAAKLLGFRALITPASNARLITAEMLDGPLAGRTVFIAGATLGPRQSAEPPCRCLAYPFPHRRGSGKCYDDGMGKFCASCGRGCDIYRPEPDSEYLSKCCHSDVYSDPELLSPYIPNNPFDTDNTNED